MAAKVTSRKFELYSMHAHGPRVDYDYFMRLITDTAPDKRVLIDGELAMAVSQVTEKDGYYFMTFVEGPVGVNPIIYDLQDASERTEELDDDEIVATRTHVLFNPKTRRAAVEYVRRGAKYFNVASVVEHIVRTQNTNLKNMSFSLSPIVEENFEKDLGSFERIRMATIKITKPNASWTDHYTSLSDFMTSSNGDRAGIEVKAAREETLSKDRGIIKVITDIANDDQPYIQDAQIRGRRKGEDAETSLSLKKHIKHSRAQVNVDENGHVSETQAYHHLKGLHES